MQIDSVSPQATQLCSLPKIWWIVTKMQMVVKEPRGLTSLGNSSKVQGYTLSPVSLKKLTQRLSVRLAIPLVPTAVNGAKSSKQKIRAC